MSGPSIHGDEDIELEWEEWDGKSPFIHHCIAGSIAGVAEHTLLYPIDTVKTHMQSYCADCPIPAAAAQQQQGGGNGSASSGSSGAAPRAGISAMEGTGRAGSAASCVVESTTSPSTSEPGLKGSHRLNKSGTSARPIQHGMVSTIRNLMAHGHSNAHLGPGQQPRHVSLAANGVSAEAMVTKFEAATAPTNVSRGMARLWRGVYSVIYGCVPAHALYFSSYEAVKAVFLEAQHSGALPGNISSESNNLGALGSSVAGATAAFFHDLIMSPLDTVKQRLQLGHYEGTSHAIKQMVRHEGPASLYRSFPITLATNLPYGVVMVTTNEYLREVIESDPTKPPDIKTSMLAGCGAGMVAAAVTTPLDRVKTRLQTQRMGTAIAYQLHEQGLPTCTKVLKGVDASAAGNCTKAMAERALERGMPSPMYGGLSDAFRSIIKEEGYAGLFLGMTPRLLTHTPAVAISWTTYEVAKRWLASSFPVNS